jgi:hypothetical protein
MQGRIQDFVQGGVQLPPGANPYKFGLGRTVCWPKVSIHARRSGWSGGPPRNILKYRCYSLRCNFRPILTVQFWRKMILMWGMWRFDSLLNYLEIGGVHSNIPSDFFGYACSLQCCWKKNNLWSRAGGGGGGGVSRPQNPQLNPRLQFPSPVTPQKASAHSATDLSGPRRPEVRSRNKPFPAYKNQENDPAV